MSVFGIEQALYDVSVRRDARQRFAANPETFLTGYPLTAAERILIKGFNMGELFRRGASPLLTLGFWMQAEGSRSMAAYLRSVRS